MSDAFPHLSPLLIMEAAAGRMQNESALRHFETCPECQNAVQEWDDTLIELQMLNRSQPEKSSEFCPGPEELAALQHSVAKNSTEAIFAHLASCAPCAGIVSAATLAGQDEPVPALRSASRAWRREMAATFVSASPRRSSILRNMSVAAAIILAAGGALWWSLSSSPEPSKLLARAYSETRPFEFRLPDDGYAPVNQRRGAGPSAAGGTSLIEAEVAIQKTLSRHPDDARALRLYAHARLMERDYPGAINSLNRALSIQPGDSQLQADLGIAYALSAERNPSALSRAVSLLSEASRKSPADQRTLFNLALVYEQAGMAPDAVRMWRSLLALNLPEGWKQEAGSHLSALELTSSPPK